MDNLLRPNRHFNAYAFKQKTAFKLNAMQQLHKWGTCRHKQIIITCKYSEIYEAGNVEIKTYTEMHKRKREKKKTPLLSDFFFSQTIQNITGQLDFSITSGAIW